MVRVVDSSVTAESPERTHEVNIDGEVTSVTFKRGEETIVPFKVGIKFMQEGFKVFKPGTDTELMVPPKTDQTIRNRISEDEVVAKYDELTVGALKVRAAAKPGGEKFLVGEVDKADMINFLKDGYIQPSLVEETVNIDEIVPKNPSAKDMSKLDALLNDVVDTKELDDGIDIGGGGTTEDAGKTAVVTVDEKPLPVAGDADFIGPVKPEGMDEAKNIKAIDAVAKPEKEEIVPLPPLPKKDDTKPVVKPEDNPGEIVPIKTAEYVEDKKG